MGIGLGVTLLTGDALAIAFEPSSLIVIGDASGFSDELFGAVGVDHRKIRGTWPLPLITRMSCGVIVGGNGEGHADACPGVVTVRAGAGSGCRGRRPVG